MAYRKRRSFKTLMELIDAWPPCLCRLLARKGRTLMTHRELAKKSGLSVDCISRWSTRRSWSEIRAKDIQAFALACGVNHVQFYRLSENIRRYKMAHLKPSMDKQQRKMVNRIISVVRPR